MAILHEQVGFNQNSLMEHSKTNQYAALLN